MSTQGRSQGGRFAPKSDEPRSVRTVRLTDTAWSKLGEMAESRGITRADLLEEWARQPPNLQLDQLTLFDTQCGERSTSREAITTETRKTGAELAHRIGKTSGAITNWQRANIVPQKTKEYDPDGFAWEREPGTRKYRPIF